MASRKKVLEVLLNAKGIPSRDQLKKLNLITKFISSLPVNVDIRKQPHELTLSEFIALHYYDIIEKDYPFLLQSREDVLKYVTLPRIKNALAMIRHELKSQHMVFVIKALSDGTPGISIETLERLQFDTTNFKSIRYYIRRFKLEI